MRRSQFIHCHGGDLARFKVLKQRKQLPFDLDGSADETGAFDFTMDHAFRMRLMLDLLGGEGDEASRLGGLGPTYAAEVVANAMHKFPRHPLNQIEPLDWFLGVVVFNEPQHGGAARLYSEALACEVQQLSAWLQNRCQRDEKGLARRVVRLFLVNVTRAAEFVRDRAEELGFADEYVFAEVPRQGS